MQKVIQIVADFEAVSVSRIVLVGVPSPHIYDRAQKSGCSLRSAVNSVHEIISSSGVSVSVVSAVASLQFSQPWIMLTVVAYLCFVFEFTYSSSLIFVFVANRGASW